MTIIEVMITLTIVTLMIGLITGVMANYLRITATSRNTVNIIGWHEKILRGLREELRQSSANRLSQQQWWIEGGGSTLRLRKLENFALDGDGNPLFTWSSDIVYTLDADGTVNRTQDGVTNGIASYVTELTFTELANGRVKIRLTNQLGNPDSAQSSTLTTEIEVTPQN